MLTEEVITNILLQEIHIGLEVRINRTDISPVRIQLICINLLYVLVTNKNVIYKIASAFCSTCLQQLNQLTTSYTYTPMDAVFVSATIGFSSKLITRLSSASFTTPKRLISSSPGWISLHTTVISAPVAICSSSTLL